MGTRLIGLLTLAMGWAISLTTATAGDNAVFVLEGDKVREVGTIPGYATICSPELSPDQKWIAVDGWKAGQSNTDAHLLLLHVETGETKDLGIGCMPSWSADGEYLTYSRYGQGVWIRSVAGNEQHQIDRHGWGAQWSPDGASIAYSVNGQLVILDGASETTRDIFPMEGGATRYSFLYWNCTWSPDSRKVCFKGRRQDGALEFAIVTVEGDDRQLQVCCDAKDYNEDIAWHPDGKSIVIPRAPQEKSAARLDRLTLDAPARLEPVTGLPLDRHNSGMCWSRDGKKLYYIQR